MIKVYRTLSLYFHTLKYLRWQQVFYRLKYVLYPRKPGIGLQEKLTLTPLPERVEDLLVKDIYTPPGTFNLLNIRKDYDGEMDWNDGGQGKLWLYHLCAMDYLNQEGMTRDVGLSLMDSLRGYSGLKEGMESWPLSLRLMNIVRFVIRHKIDNPEINGWIKVQYDYLGRHIEWHLMANHLLENLFALTTVSILLREEHAAIRYGTLLHKQLKEQILADGGHFERSPMYHAVILNRILDLYNLQLSNSGHPSPLAQSILKDYAERMLGWLEQMTMPDGTWAHFQDSTGDVAPMTKELVSYSARLGICPRLIPLGASGYRRYEKEGSYVLLIDAGDILAKYQPGHAHCSMLSFVLYLGTRPLIVDTGISSYEMEKYRSFERSTLAHNTVQIDDREQSEIWASFRMGRRAKMLQIVEKDGEFTGEMIGYGRGKIGHTRRFILEDGALTIVDTLSGKKNGQKAYAYLHFTSDIEIKIEQNQISLSGIPLLVSGASLLEEFRYERALGFNRREGAKGIRIAFDDHLSCRFELRD